MTRKEIQDFKTLFRKYCREEISKERCTPDTCDICKVNNAYEEIFDRLSEGEDDDSSLGLSVIVEKPNLEKALESVGISIYEKDGTYKFTENILREMADKWREIQQLDIAQDEDKGNQTKLKNKWHLTDFVRERSGPRVKAILNMIDEGDGTGDLKEFDLSDLGFTPYTLCEYLEELGYEKGTQDDNGWELDFWIPFRKDGHTPIEVFGTGIIFELGIREMDYDWKEKERKQEEQMSKLGDEALDLLLQVKQLLGEES